MSLSVASVLILQQSDSVFMSVYQLFPIIWRKELHGGGYDADRGVGKQAVLLLLLLLYYVCKTDHAKFPFLFPRPTDPIRIKIRGQPEAKKKKLRESESALVNE